MSIMVGILQRTQWPMLEALKAKLEGKFKIEWNWLSVKGLAYAAAIQAGWLAMPDAAKAVFPDNTGNYVALVTYLVIFVLRGIVQND
jgi:hypothetical protein